MTRQSTLIHAAELLEREAEAIRVCSTFRGTLGEKWDTEDAKDDHDDMLQTARALRDMAVTTPFEPGCK